MQITLDKEDIIEAVKQYMESAFGMTAPGIEISATKGNITAAITLDQKVQIGPGTVEVIASKPKVDAAPFEVNEPKEKKKPGPKPKEPVKEEAKELVKEKTIVEDTEELVEEESAVSNSVTADSLFAV